ncbi:MAG TPA: hypothetical protein VGE01_08285 [Fimbriimonas sp.]
MRYYVFTFDGYGLPIAHRLQREGHEVVVAQVEDQGQVLSELEQGLPDEDAESKQRRLSLYDGLLDKRPADKVMEDLRRGRKKDAFVFFDLNHLFRYAEEVEELGYHGNFPRGDDYILEIDRERAKSFVGDNYPMVRVGENHRFDRAAQAKRFLKNTDELWVLKGIQEDARTVVPNTDDVALAQNQILDALEKDLETYESAGFILEKKITPALEYTPERLYYDGRLVATLLVIENKDLGAGNVGPQTDCSQDLVFLIEDDCKIARMAFPPIVDEMAKAHRGLFLWDASLYVDPRTGRAYFGEFCANRPGYNSLYNQISLAGSASRLFESAVEGKAPYPVNEVGTSVRIFNLHQSEGRPLAGAAVEILPEVEQNLFLVDVRQKSRRLATAGYKDTLGVAVGSGHSVSEAARAAHRAIGGLSFEGAFYRPYFDLISRDYRTSIVNRIDYGLQLGYYKVGFGLS